MSKEYKPELLAVGDKVKFFRESQTYTVQAMSNRYAICTKPFNLKHTVLYTIIDFKENIRGPENLIFGMGAETKDQCYEMLIRLLDEETEVSSRHSINLDLHWIKNSEKEFIYNHEHGATTVNEMLDRLEAKR